MSNRKILSINKLKSRLLSHKRKDKRIVFTNGCFDILHYGHIAYLNKAKQCGDILVVAVNSDHSVKLIKDRTRPIIPLKDRIRIIASLDCVDYACSFNESTPLSLMKKLKPDIIVKGADWKKEEIVGAKFVQSYGGKVKRIKFLKGYSTTNIIKIIEKQRV